tara:strand:- start:22301 stop:22768 length:468 start_codon:yes stop_codon:yes gene_type:complete
MNDRSQLDKYDTQEIARALDAYPTPLLANVDLQNRWHCSRSTVDRIRKAHDLRSDGPSDSHPSFDLLIILELEGMPDPLVAWAMGTYEDRKILTAPLLSIDDLRLLDRTAGGHHLETFRRRARTGSKPGFRIGRRWLFRPSIQDLARLTALRNAQ